MSKYAWQVTLNKYDNSGVDHLYIKADRCYTENGSISFIRDGERTEDNPYPEGVLVVYLPSDRVFEVELLDNVTGEPAGFLPPEP